MTQKKVVDGPFVFYIDVHVKIFYRGKLKTLTHSTFVFMDVYNQIFYAKSENLIKSSIFIIK